MSDGQRAAIVGVGQTEFARAIPDKSTLHLHVQAAKAAADDAGIPLHEIDGVLVGAEGGGGRYENPRYHHVIKESLGLYDTTLALSTMSSGVSPGVSLEIARQAVLSGQCKYVLYIGGWKASDKGGILKVGDKGNAYTDMVSVVNMHYPDYEHPFGPTMVSFYGSVASRHMYEYGTTEEQLSGVSVAFRHNASLNPAAVYRRPITIEDVMNSRMISSPLHKLHCCIINDGAVAFLVTTEERAKDLKQKPVFVAGGGSGQTGYWTGFIAGGDPSGEYSLTRTMGKRAADDAFDEAGVRPEEIDVVELLDNFAISPVILLEDFGFCGKGEGGEFVGDGRRLMVGGDLPTNTHGGALSCNHAAIGTGNYAEATVQLRGEAGERQVPGAKLAFASCGAGICSTHMAHILSID